jgi:hypothetical protein
MGSMSRCKGAAGEREAAGKLNEVLGTRFPRGRQYHCGPEVAAGRGGRVSDPTAGRRGCVLGTAGIGPSRLWRVFMGPES